LPHLFLEFGVGLGVGPPGQHQHGCTQ
jgi:hypothetical protein